METETNLNRHLIQKKPNNFGRVFGVLKSTHEKDAECLKKLKEEVEFPQQAELSITIGIVTQFLKKF